MFSKTGDPTVPFLPVSSRPPPLFPSFPSFLLPFEDGTTGGQGYLPGTFLESYMHAFRRHFVQMYPPQPCHSVEQNLSDLRSVGILWSSETRTLYFPVIAALLAGCFLIIKGDQTNITGGITNQNSFLLHSQTDCPEEPPIETYPFFIHKLTL